MSSSAFGNIPRGSSRTVFDNILKEIVNETNNNIIAAPNVTEQQDTPNSPDPHEEQNEPNNHTSSSNVPHKVDLIMLTNGWNEKNERIIISIGENAASYKWMHEKSAGYFQSANQILTIILLIFSTGLSAGTILPDNTDNKGFDITRRIFTYIVTFMSILLNFLKYEKLSQQHKSAAMSFSLLYHNIQQQMCMFRRDRTNASKYVPTTLKEYDSLIMGAPNINQNVVQKFKNTFKNSDISIPDIADRIQKIEIITEPNNSSRIVGNIGIDPNSVTQSKEIVGMNENKRYGRYGVCNLNQIHNAFQIHGDISDKDIENSSAVELRQLRNKYIKNRSDYEYQRFLNHATEND